jgi:uncharacterized protein YjbI with pentapeptide repeats
MQDLYQNLSIYILFSVMPQNFSGQNLRGRSFKGQNLEDADFSRADIRGTNFTGANLQGANFSKANAGLQKRWVIVIVGISWLLTGISGLFSGLAGYLISIIFSTTKGDKVVASVVLIIIIALIAIIVRQGINAAFAFIIPGVFVVAGGVAFIFLLLAWPKLFSEVAAFAGPLIFKNIAVAFGLVFAVSFIGLLAAALAFFGFAFTLIFAVVFALAKVVDKAVLKVVTFVFTFAFVFAFAGIMANALTRVTIGAFIAGAFAIIFVLPSVYIAHQAINGSEKYALVRNLTIMLAAFRGTSFRGTNLTDANFTEATLKSTDFRNANLIRTRWRNAKQLDHVRPGKTYLENEQVRQLVITGEGKGKKFDRLDLRGLNLRETDLQNASFIDTDFYQANLQGANLSRTILVRTNFERADLRDTNLTGSCIQDWVITESTKLDGIICDYIYLKWVDGDKRDQMPPRGQFKEGGFVTFVKYILDTVELYHEKDINPRLVLTVLQKMSRDYDELFDIVALGKRGEKVFIQVKVSENIIREDFKEDYYSRYDTDLKLWSGNIHQLPPSVNSFIEKRISEIASEKTDDFVFVDVKYVEGNYTETYQGEVNMSGDSEALPAKRDRNINIGSGNYNERIEGDYVQGNSYKGKHSSFNLQGAQFAGGLVDAETVNAHQIGGNITNNTQAAQTETNDSAVKTILILASNPRTTASLRLDEEVREIDAGLQRAKKRELFDLKQRWAVRVQDVYQSLLDFNPSIVHFSGHGSGDEGLVLEDETGNVRLVETVALAGLFEVFANRIECVVLNACYSERQASAIAQHIPYVIGMSKEIGDKAAIKFATGFYSALGSGECVEFAYKLGCSVVQLDGIAEHLTPVLKKR